MMRKKGQTGMSAAVLVAVIAGLMILYILFLPENEKQYLLDDIPRSDGGDGNGASSNEDVLLSEGGITLDPIDNIEEKDLPNIYLIEERNAQKIAEINPFTIRNGWFDEKKKTASFRIDNLEDTDNVILSFAAGKRNGILTVKLNSEIVYEFEPSTNSIVVEFDNEVLERENTLEFSVSPVGIAFWKTNEYSIENVKIHGDITDRTRQASRNVIELSESEYDHMQSADLKFIPYCSRLSDVGTLTLSINGRTVYDAVPVCDDPVKVPVKNVLDIGENKVIFKTSKGSYSIEQIRLDIEVEEEKTREYYFELTNEQFKDVENGDMAVNISIDFVDDDEDKRATFSINRRKRTIDQDEPDFDYDISSWVETGNNYLEIIPKNTLRIVDLEVLLWEK